MDRHRAVVARGREGLRRIALEKDMLRRELLKPLRRKMEEI